MYKRVEKNVILCKLYSISILACWDLLNELNGTQINYYFICKRKLWLFSHNISFESLSDLVSIGKIIDSQSYKRKKKNIKIGNIALDHIEHNIIHEIKKSDKIEEAHKYQLLYYIYYLTKLGINTTGIINYPKLKKTLKVTLQKQDRINVEKIIKDANTIISANKPPKADYKKICDKCAYYDYCWS